MKVAVIGAGDVGATAAQRIAEADLADVVMVDIAEGKARAKALDLNSASSIIRHSRSIKGTSDYKRITGADIVVITAGQTRKPGLSREDLLLTNAKIVKYASERIAQYCSEAVVIVVTNPVDVMTYLAYKTCGFARNQIIGMGGICDCARFNMLVADELNTASYHIQSIILGAHADSMVIIPRLSTILGVPITEMLPKNRIEHICAATRNFGANIVKLLGKGSAYYGPSAGILLLVDSIIKDRRSILCAATYLNGQYGLNELCIGVPVRIGRLGAEEIVELHLTEAEKKALQASAKTVKTLIKKLGA